MGGTKGGTLPTLHPLLTSPIERGKNPKDSVRLLGGRMVAVKHVILTVFGKDLSPHAQTGQETGLGKREEREDIIAERRLYNPI